MPASALVRRVLFGLLAANLVVVGAKLAVAIASKSLAVFGSALDSSVDALNNVLALIVVRVAAKAPDEDHPYGHGKFETLGALAIVGFLSVTCFELVRGAVNDLARGTRRVSVSDIQEPAQAVRGVKSAYAIRSRGPSDLRYAEVTIAVDRHADVESAHAIADEVEDRLKRELQLHEVTVHIEPC